MDYNKIYITKTPKSDMTDGRHIFKKNHFLLNGLCDVCGILYEDAISNHNDGRVPISKIQVGGQICTETLGTQMLCNLHIC